MDNRRTVYAKYDKTVMNHLIKLQKKTLLMRRVILVCKGTHIVYFDRSQEGLQLREVFNDDTSKQMEVNSSYKIVNSSDYLDMEDKGLYNIVNVLVDGYVSNIRLYEENPDNLLGFFVTDKVLKHFTDDSKRDIYFILKKKSPSYPEFETFR